MQNYNVTSVRASPITMSRRNWDLSPYKLQMNLVLLPNNMVRRRKKRIHGRFFVFHSSNYR